MAKCKCRVCGKTLDTSEAFKVECKPPKYFCSQSEFEAEEERKIKVIEDRAKIYRLICDILGEQDIINSVLWKEVQVWRQVADYAAIVRYLEDDKEYLTKAIGKLENKIYNRIRYLSAVVKNKLGDYKPKVQDEVKVQFKVRPVVDIDTTVYDEPTHSLNKRRSLADLEDEL